MPFSSPEHQSRNKRLNDLQETYRGVKYKHTGFGSVCRDMKTAKQCLSAHRAYGHAAVYIGKTLAGFQSEGFGLFPRS